jgi:hypothetical protein
MEKYLFQYIINMYNTYYSFINTNFINTNLNNKNKLYKNYIIYIRH